MKNLFAVIFLLACFVSCHTPRQAGDVLPGEQSSTFSAYHDDILETAVIYEVNIRQYSPEGTFEAFTHDIPSLKNLGIRILWLMPIHPISIAKRKGTLGSYYAVHDYGEINPEFGDLDDFRNLVQTAHENGMYVILDWVANHTGWDHPWITDHPEYYTQNSEGEIVDPLDPSTGESWGWTDVADLNYDNEEMREKMIGEMMYWVRDENVDGFRCDVAHQVPVDFWEQAVNRLQEEKSLFMLAEAEQPELLVNAFDMQYAWEGHHILNGMARGERTVMDLKEYLVHSDSLLEEDDILMNFTSNHDENTWSGTVRERMGEAAEVMAVTTYMIPGMPLIYNGQEYDLDKRLRFFEKDTIPKDEKGEFYALYEALGELKNTHPALNGGKQGAACHFLPTNEEGKVLALLREKDGRKIVFLANLSDEAVEVKIDWDHLDPDLSGSLTGTRYTEYFHGEAVEIDRDGTYSLDAWSYRVWVD